MRMCYENVFPILIHNHQSLKNLKKLHKAMNGKEILAWRNLTLELWLTLLQFLSLTQVQYGYVFGRKVQGRCGQKQQPGRTPLEAVYILVFVWHLRFLWESLSLSLPLSLSLSFSLSIYLSSLVTELLWHFPLTPWLMDKNAQEERESMRMCGG